MNACPKCDRPAIATVATGGASVRLVDGYELCGVAPSQHGGVGFRYYIHEVSQ